MFEHAETNQTCATCLVISLRFFNSYIYIFLSIYFHECGVSISMDNCQANYEAYCCILCIRVFLSSDFRSLTEARHLVPPHMFVTRRGVYVLFKHKKHLMIWGKNSPPQHLFIRVFFPYKTNIAFFMSDLLFVTREKITEGPKQQTKNTWFLSELTRCP